PNPCPIEENWKRNISLRIKKAEEQCLCLSYILIISVWWWARLSCMWWRALSSTASMWRGSWFTGVWRWTRFTCMWWWACGIIFIFIIDAKNVDLSEYWFVVTRSTVHFSEICVDMQNVNFRSIGQIIRN